MKKIITIILTLCILLSLTACDNSKTAVFGTPQDDYTQYFNFALINGKYCALSVKQNIKIPEILVVPNQYNGIEVAYTGAQLLNALPVKTIIFESGVECSYCLCGEGNNCPTLEKIIFLSENPKDCLKGKLLTAKNMPLQLNKEQLDGKCKIYIPDSKTEEYKKAWGEFKRDYGDLLHPLSELDNETAKYIK